MVDRLPPEELIGNGFGETTAQILGHVGIHVLLPPPLLPISDLDGYDHIISDIDGVVRPYDGDVTDEIAAWYAQLEGRVSFVSLNPKMRGMLRFLGAPAYIARHPTPIIGKAPLMREAISKADAAAKDASAENSIDKKKVLAIGDGLTDAISAKLAGIPNVALVNSRGGSHPRQEFVHNFLYARALRTADQVAKAQRRHYR